MKIALSTWKNRISPVFDAARQVVVLDIEDGQVRDRRTEALPEAPTMKVAKLQQLEVDALVCGAISHPLAETVAAHNIRVYPFVAGDADEVLEACLSDALRKPCFAMPGCRGVNKGFKGVCAGGCGQRRRNMPRGDGTGPEGKGPATGRNSQNGGCRGQGGSGRGMGGGRAQGGKGRGQGGQGRGLGQGGGVGRKDGQGRK